MLPRHALDSRALVYVPHVAAAPVKAHGHGACERVQESSEPAPEFGFGSDSSRSAVLPVVVVVLLLLLVVLRVRTGVTLTSAQQQQGLVKHRHKSLPLQFKLQALHACREFCGLRRRQFRQRLEQPTCCAQQR